MCARCGGTGVVAIRTYIPGQKRSDADGYTEAIAKASRDIDARDARRAARLRDAESDPMHAFAKAYGTAEPLAKALARREAALNGLAEMAGEVQRTSAFSVSEAQAMDRVLKTAKGRELYAELDAASFDAVRKMDGF